MSIKLKRKAYDKLLEWKRDSNGSTALLINGARRIGKSYLVNEFGQNEYKSYLCIDFSRRDMNVIGFFENDSYDLDIFFEKLSAYYGVTLFPKESLIIFDEVQAYPFARQLVKHLVADGRYHYIETGSLLSIRANVQDIVIPSEEVDFFLHPLDFEEFLWALGDHTSYPYIQKCMEEQKPLGESIHRKIMNQFRRYMLVGGMPKVVSEYIESGSFENAEREKRLILRTYRKDIVKFAGVMSNEVEAVFDNIPGQLTKKEKKFKVASLDKDRRRRDFEDAFAWLVDSDVVNLCVNLTDPNVGLNMSECRESIKLYMADTGLLVTMAMDSGNLTKENVYKALLTDSIGINEGMFVENIVAQMLRSNDRKLYFYSRYRRVDESGIAHGETMEIDFILGSGVRIRPLEVKSSKRIRYVSLERFREKYWDRVTKPTVLCDKDISVNDGVLILPIYAAGLL